MAVAVVYFIFFWENIRGKEWQNMISWKSLHVHTYIGIYIYVPQINRGSTAKSVFDLFFFLFKFNNNYVATRMLHVQCMRCLSVSTIKSKTAHSHIICIGTHVHKYKRFSKALLWLDFVADTQFQMLINFGCREIQKTEN